MINIETIKPQTKGQSDKYSWNLYEYLRKNRGEHRILLDVNDKDFVPNNIYVAFGETGNSLLGIMRGVKDRYYYGFPEEQYSDITKEFWEHYVAKGRCVVDKRHEQWWTNDDHRYTMIDNDTKKCQWCGAVLRRYVEVVAKTVESWEVE